MEERVVCVCVITLEARERERAREFGISERDFMNE